MCYVSVCSSVQLNYLNDDYEYSVQFTKNSRGLGFTISGYIGDLNSGDIIHCELVNLLTDQLTINNPKIA